MGKARTQTATVVLDAGGLIAFERADARMRALLRQAIASGARIIQVLAEAAGVLCGRTGTADVIDASVVLTARRERAVVVTSAVDDLRRLDRALELQRI